MKLSIQVKLFLASVIISFVIGFSAFIILNNYITNLIIQQQVSFNLYSFENFKKQFKAIHQEIEIYLKRIDENARIESLLTSPFDKGDIIKLHNRVRDFYGEVSGILVRKDFIDSIIIVGINNFSYGYLTGDRSKFFGEDLEFHRLYYNLKNKFGLVNKEGIPFYVNRIIAKSGSEFQSSAERSILSQIEGHVVLLRTLHGGSYEKVVGIAIVVLNTNFIAGNFQYAGRLHTIKVIDKENNVVWSTGEGIKISTLITTEEIHSQYKSGNQYSIVKGKYLWKVLFPGVLVTYEEIKPYGFFVVDAIKVNDITKRSISLRIFLLEIGLICAFYILLVSFFSSKWITFPLVKVARDVPEKYLSKEGEKNARRKKSIFDFFWERYHFPKGGIRFRYKLILYFFLSTIVPILIFITLSINKYYTYYKDEVILFSTKSLNLVKRNIDYRFKTFDFLLQQIVFDRRIQSLLSSSVSKRGVKNKSSIDALLLNFQGSRYRSEWNMYLYDANWNTVYSTRYYYREGKAFLTDELLEKLNESSGELIFLGIKYNYYLDPELTFMRKINDVYQRDNYPLIGYARIGITADFVKNMASVSEEDLPGNFVIADGNNGYISTYSTSLNWLFPYVVEGGIRSGVRGIEKGKFRTGSKNPVLIKEVKGLGNVFTLRKGDQNYTIIMDKSDLFPVSYFKIIPDVVVRSKIIPFYQYSLLVLLAVFVLLVGISYLVARGILDSLGTLLGEIEEAIEKKKTNFDFNVKGNDEISYIYMRFNEMAKRIDELVRENYISKIHEKELMILQRETQLWAFQQQINPHFLYNALESINWMAYMAGAKDICNMVSVLGKFLRDAIKNDEIITIYDEVSNLKDYVYIQELRYGERLRVKFSIDKDIYRCRIVKLTLQPIVENAINHGIGELETGGEIEILGDKKNGRVELIVRDNGKGMDETILRRIMGSLESSVEMKRNIGIRNVYMRLKLFFGKDLNLKIDSKPGNGTSLMLSFPCIE